MDLLTRTPRLAGVILCGGHSSRMGRPKAWLPFGPVPLLTRVAARLQAVAAPVVVVAAAGQDLPPLPPGVEIARDSAPDCGPLEGLRTGLLAVAGRAEAVFVCACDAPFVQPAFARRLAERLGPNLACVPRAGGRLHPLAAVYRVGAAEAAGRLLADGKRALLALLDAVPIQIVEGEELTDVDPTLASLRNLNTPADYAAALAEIAG